MRAGPARVRAAADGGTDERDTPLFRACGGDAPAATRIAIATRLLDAGAKVRHGSTGNVTALHAAARRGPLALVELLIRRGAFTWQTGEDGKDALAYARAGIAPDKDALVELLDRPVIRDPRFKAAVAAIHRGDVAALARLLDGHPTLLTDRAIEPDCYPQDYFRDPKLFWFVANNPTLTRKLSATIVAIARTMIARGVPRSDLDYALELVMSNGNVPDRGVQIPLLAALVDAGATASPRSIVVALAHWETRPVEALLERGAALTAPIAAALGRDEALAALLPAASPADLQDSLGLAVINRRLEAARLCLAAGADASAFLPVHAHSTPLHQATINDDLEMMKLLLAHGARADIKDTLWNGTPLGWAIHNKKTKAEALLRSEIAPIATPPAKKAGTR